MCGHPNNYMRLFIDRLFMVDERVIVLFKLDFFLWAFFENDEIRFFYVFSRE